MVVGLVHKCSEGCSGILLPMIMRKKSISILIINARNGVGLGLIICKQLCGYIGPLQYMYLRSEVSVGSTF